MTTYEFTAELWQWRAEEDEPGSWWFVSLPHDVADEIAARVTPGRGFGAVRVEASVGGTSWATSVFPSAGKKTYLLPVKKAVRAAEGLLDGGVCSVRLRLARAAAPGG